MGTITTGVGLVSGIDTAGLIDSLIALESRGKATIERRIANLQAQQTALLDINARLLSLKSAAGSFRADNIFQSALAKSSNESILTASARPTAKPGTFNFIVKQLVTSSQKLSRGFSDYDTSPIGMESLTFSLGKGALDPDRNLDELNGGEGVRLGKINITDQSGAQATVNLSDVSTLNEVIKRINDKEGIAVTARLEGDGLVIEDTSGGSGSLTIANATGSFAATDLGIVGSDSGGAIVGTNINTLGNNTSLQSLNDGTGVLTRNNNPDLRITTADGALHNIDLGRINADIDTDTLLSALNNGEGVTLSDDNDNPDIKFVARDGTEYEVNLTGVTTVNGLINRINNQTGGHIQLSITDGDRLTITDTVGGDGELQILGAGENEDATAKDLGIFTEGVDEDSFTGEAIPNTIQKGPATTLGEVVKRINEQSEGAVTASINQSTGALQIIDNTAGGGNLTIRGTTANPFAAGQLGIETSSEGEASGIVDGQRLVAELGSVLTRNLNGGSGLEGGSLTITDRTGASMQVNGLDGLHSLSQIVRAINDQATADNVSIEAKLNNAGTGLEITDTSGGSANNLIIEGSAASSLGIDADTAETSVRGTHLHAAYATEASKLSDLNYGRGIGDGSFRITDGFGKSATINIGSNQTTLYDVIQVINAQGGNGGLAVKARVNDTGNGLMIEEDLTYSSGAEPFVRMRVDANNGTTARDLNILGEADSISEARIDGGYTRTIEFGDGDTLQDVVEKINESGVPISASILNTGSGANGYRINLTSEVTGRRGEMIIDSGTFDLGLNTLSKGQDAKVLVGGGEAAGADGFLVTSSSNSLNNVIPGVSIDLHAVSEDPVSLSVSRDQDRIITAVERFVNSFNETIARIDEYDFYDVEEEQRGVLLGNPTSSRVRATLMRSIQLPAEGVDTQYRFLREVGIRIGQGAKLEFDQDRFLEAWENNPEAVEALFAAYESTPKSSEEIAPGITIEHTGDDVTTRGLGNIFDHLLGNLTDSVNGTLTLADNAFRSQIELSQERMSLMNERLERRREQLTRQFAGMESALAQLQSQSSALGSLANNVQLAGSVFG